MDGIDPRLLAILYEALQEAVDDFAVTCGVRSARQQHDLWKQGRSKPGRIVTQLDGYERRSKHQVDLETGLGRAADVVILVDGEASWDFGRYGALAKTMKAVARRHGVEILWGGDWPSRDGPHFELA